FDDGELEATRELFNSLLPGTCNILSRSVSGDGMGGGTVTWGTAVAGVACAVWRAGQRPMEAGLGRFHEGSELVAQAEYTFGMPHDTTIDESQRIERDGVVFQIIRVDDVLPDQVQLRVWVRKTESDE